MAKSRVSKKVKQVAAKAKSKKPVAPVVTAEYNTGKHGIDALPAPVPEPTVNVMETPEGVEFNVGESTQEAKSKAIARSERVNLKLEIRTIVSEFSKRIDERLTELSKQIEAQLQPLVRTVADIAVAKRELSQELMSFGENLSGTLNLNDELDPIDIESMFAIDVEPLENLSFVVQTGESPLGEAVADIRHQAHMEAIRNADAQLAGKAVEAVEENDSDTVN